MVSLQWFNTKIGSEKILSSILLRNRIKNKKTNEQPRPSPNLIPIIPVKAQPRILVGPSRLGQPSERMDLKLDQDPTEPEDTS